MQQSEKNLHVFLWFRCVVAKEHKDMPYAFNEPGLQQEVAPYTAQDFLAEMKEPKVESMTPCLHQLLCTTG